MLITPDPDQASGADMARRVIAASLGVTYCRVTVAWRFALIKTMAWLSDGLVAFAHSASNHATFFASLQTFQFSQRATGHGLFGHRVDRVWFFHGRAAGRC